MLLIFHITVALGSIAIASASYFYPSKAKLSTSYWFVVLTLISGAYLVWSTHVNILSVCATGLAYLAIVSASMIAARYRLRAVTAEI